MMLSRRSFLLAALGSLASGACSPRRAGRVGAGLPLIDFHVHLFGVGVGGTGCFISPAQKRHPSYRFLLQLLDIEENDAMDSAYVERMVQQLHASDVDMAVLLAQDGRYDERGRLQQQDTHFYVPNDYLFDVVSRYPDLFVACASINPKRPDALEELERCAEKGARIVKIHPPTQDVDPADPRLRPFYRRMAELDVILMVHTGTEHATYTVGYENCDPARLEPALQEGCTVVAAHSGFGSFLDGIDFCPSLERLVQRYPKLYCDTAVLATAFRWRNLPRLLGSPGVSARSVYASDWPFPANALVFWNRMAPLDLAPLLEAHNLFTRDLGIKRALGFPSAHFQRGAHLLGLA